MRTDDARRYGPTGGLIIGWIGLVGCAVVAIVLPFTGQDRETLRFALAVALVGVVIWAFVVRPRIILTATTLELRNPLSAWSVPVDLVDKVEVDFTTRVTAMGRTLNATGVGRNPRGLTRTATPPWTSADRVVDIMVQDVLAAAAQARGADPAGGAIERHWAVPELAVIAVLSLAVLVLSV